jgi:hypothetical protein
MSCSNGDSLLESTTTDENEINKSVENSDAKIVILSKEDTNFTVNRRVKEIKLYSGISNNKTVI